MSWYNDDLNNGFIDTTQDFVGGGGGYTTSIQEDLTDLKEVFIPKQINPLTSIVETYIKNTYINSKIYIVNNNTEPKVKIEGGHLYVYYDYDPVISLLDLSQYLKVSDYIVGVNVGVRNLNVAISALGQVVNTHTTDILAITTSLTTQAGAITVIGNDLVILDEIVISQGVRITRLEGGEIYYHSPSPGTYERVIQDLAQLRAGIRLRAFTKENLSQLGFFIRNAIPVALAFLGLTGVIAVAVSGIQYIRDIILSDQENKNLKILKEVYDIKNEDADFNVKNKLFHTGLSVSPTNNNGMTDGKYSINLRNGNVVIDFIVVGGVASVEWVDKTDEPNSVGDFFNIDKSLLGGSVGSGSIRLDVTAVFSIKEIVEYMMNQSYLKAEDIKGRQRRRDKILNEDTIGNNFILI